MSLAGNMHLVHRQMSRRYLPSQRLRLFRQACTTRYNLTIVGPWLWDSCHLLQAQAQQGGHWTCGMRPVGNRP